MATQVQIRGTSQATQEARTLVSRELDINTTDNRLCVHNGSTAGGVRHVNMFDQQNNEFNYAQASGTNALTASMRIAPTSYIAGQVFWIKIANTNTGSVTLNIDSLGAKTVKKVFNNALANLQANDLVSGQMIGVLYDGTDFQIVSGSGSEAGRQSWIPSITSSTVGNIYISYTVEEAFYVDYGDSVTVAIRASFSSTVGSYPYPAYVSNLPFSPEIGVYGRGLRGSSGVIDFYIGQGSSTIRIADFSHSASSFQITCTYIKD